MLVHVRTKASGRKTNTNRKTWYKQKVVEYNIISVSSNLHSAEVTSGQRFSASQGFTLFVHLSVRTNTEHSAMQAEIYRVCQAPAVTVNL